MVFGGVGMFVVWGIIDFKSGMSGFVEILIESEIWDMLVYICLIWL